MKKIFVLYLIFICLFSCSKSKNEILIDEENKITLNNVLKSNNLTFIKKDVVYKLNVNNSKLKTRLGEEMGASISALILYDLVITNNPQIEYNTFFEINYEDRRIKYAYSLQDLSDVIKGQSIIDDFITNLHKDNPLERIDCSTIETKLKNIDNLIIKDISFAGFKLKDENNIIYYRVFLDSTKIELNFYLERESKKILRIE